MPVRHRPWGVGVALVSALALTACSAGDGDDAAGEEQRVFAEAEEGAYPVTIPHAYGETEIDDQPQRVVVIGWAGSDIVVDLGTIPVAQGIAAGDVDGDYYPWFEEAAGALGGPLPAVHASLERGEVDLEYVLSQDPDLILAVNSGVTEEEYARLTEIAPTVAFPEDPWATSIDEHVEIVGAALGRPRAAQEIEDALARTLDEVAAAHPQLDGVTFVQGFVPGDDGQLVVYATSDARVQTLQALGLAPADGLIALEDASDASSSYATSLEEVLPLRPDLFITVASDEQWHGALQAHAAFASWEPVADDRVARLVDPGLSMAYATATPLSLTWGIAAVADILTEAME